MEQAFARLKQAIDYLKDSGKIHKQQDIVDTLGMSKPNVSRALTATPRYFTKGFLKRFARAYSDYINEDWLLTGEGKMGKPSKDMRPHFPATVEAGLLGGDSPTVMDYEVDRQPVIKHFPSYDYTIDVSGHSMEPSYFDGDVVACRRLYDQREVTPGKTYVIVTQDGAVIKRIVSSTISSLRLSSDNPDYRPYNVDKDSIISIAEVVGSIRTSQESENSVRDTYLRYLKNVIASNYGDLSESRREEIVKQILHK